MTCDNLPVEFVEYLVEPTKVIQTKNKTIKIRKGETKVYIQVILNK